jgi:hypothetical protein
MPVILNENSISVGGKIIETSKFELSTLPTTFPVITPVDVVAGYKYFAFPYGYQVLARDATNLKAWYKMENNLDSSGNDFNLTFQGAAAISTDDGVLANKYLVLNGDNNYADIPLALNIYNIYNNATTIGGTEIGITFSLWFKATTTSTANPRLFEFVDGGTAPNHLIIYKNGTNVAFLVTPGFQYISNGISFFDGNWRHICISVASDNKWYIYVNGSVVLNGTNTSPIPNTTYTRQYIGKGFGATDGYNTNGGVEDFRIYNVALTATEVLALYNSGTQTSYTASFPDPAGTLCDILVVGGGGGGGGNISGGGGAGGVAVIEQISLFGTYNVNIGKGGIKNVAAEDGESDGKNSSITNGTNTIIVIGGGGGGHQYGLVEAGNNGGSGGGGCGSSNPGNSAGGLSQVGTKTGIFNNAIFYGNNGGIGANQQTPTVAYFGAGGGGGANTLTGVGGNGLRSASSISTTLGGKGGDGINMSYIFGTNVGQNGYFAGGGGGGLYNDTNGQFTFAQGGLGGGGKSAYFSTLNAENGLANTGGGGGGGSYQIQNGGNGGSGIVIIRYKVPTNLTFDAQWTYSSSNANVYYPSGNVGIGMTNPTSALHVLGDTFSTTYSGGSKTFKIEHPLKINKWLYHGCIEGPRFDNIYRGKKLIVEGKAEVDIDAECNTTGGMTSGTFPALNTNYQLYLQNNKTFDRVKGSIEGSKIQIESQNVIDEIEIDWLVVGERHDKNVINPDFTDSDGNLICEHYFPGYNKDNSGEIERIANIDVTEEYTISQQGNNSNVIIEEDASNASNTSNI